MSALLTHLTAVERLAAHVNELPVEFAKALSEDLEYARFGAAIAELPRFGGWTTGIDTWLARGHRPYFSELMTACEWEAASVESGKRLVLTWINYSKPEELPKTNAQ